MLIVVLSILAATFVLSEMRTAQSQGMIRCYGMIGGLWLIGILTIENPWLQALLGLLLINWLRQPQPGMHLSRVMPLAMLTLAGSLLLDYLGASLVFPSLLAIALVGVYLTGRLLWEWYANVPLTFAGQENSNNLQAISLISLCASCGLILAYSWWYAILVPFSLYPLLLVQYQFGVLTGTSKTVTLGIGLIPLVIVFALPLWIGWWGAAAVLPAVTAMVWGCGQALRHEVWWDSGRVRAWLIMLTAGWWMPGWRTRLLGQGWQSWLPFHEYVLKAATSMKQQKVVRTDVLLSTAHNEFIQMLFEHGLIGLTLLIGYCFSILWQLGHGSGEAQAVYLVGSGLIAVALVLHPWTWYHHTATQADKDGKPMLGGQGVMLYSIGSPALNYMTFLTIVMAESVLF